MISNTTLKKQSTLYPSCLTKNTALYAAAFYATYHCNSIIEQWFTKHDYMQLLVNMNLLEYSQDSYRVHSRDQTTKHQTRQQIYLKTYNRICAKLVNRQEWGSYILYDAENKFYMTSMCLMGAMAWLVSPLYVSDCLSSWRKIGRSMGIIADTVFLKSVSYIVIVYLHKQKSTPLCGKSN